MIEGIDEERDAGGLQGADSGDAAGRPAGYAAPDLGWAAGGRLFRAWDKSRHRTGLLLPRRTDFDPFDIPDLVPILVLTEFTPPDDLVFRLHGGDLTELVGIELKGVEFRSIERPQPFRVSRELIRRMVAQPCGLFMAVRFSTNTWRTVRALTLMLPFAPCAGRPYRLVGLTDVVETTFEANESTMEILSIDEAGFVDVGAGVPAEPVWTAADAALPDWQAPVVRRFG